MSAIDALCVVILFWSLVVGYFLNWNQDWLKSKLRPSVYIPLAFVPMGMVIAVLLMLVGGWQ